MGILWNTAPWLTSSPPRPAASRSCTACSPRSWTSCPAAPPRPSRRAPVGSCPPAGSATSRSTAGRSGPPSSARPAPGSASGGWTGATARRSTSAGSGYRPGRHHRRRHGAAGLAGARRPAVLLRHRWPPRWAVGRRRHFQLAGIAPDDASSTIHDESSREPRRPRPRRRPTALLAALGAPHRPDARHRRHDPGRAGRRDPLPLAGSGRVRAAPAPGRPRSRCTGRPTCSTPTASSWPAAACWWSARARLPRVHRAGAAVARRVRRRVHHARRLHHGVDATAPDAPEVAAAEGRPRMCAVLRAAVAAGRPCPTSRSGSRSTRSAVTSTGPVATRARRAARDSGRLHNAARMVFAEALVASSSTRRRLITGGVLADPDDRDLDRLSRATRRPRPG